MITPHQIGVRAMAGAEFIDIRDTGDGIRVYRKNIKDADVIPHCQTLLMQALHDIAVLNGITEKQIPANVDKSLEELAREFFHRDTEEWTVGTGFDHAAQITAKVGEAFAILSYVFGENVFVR